MRGERTLCEAPIRVALCERGPHVELALPELRLETTACALASALEGIGVQISAPEGYCRIEVHDGTVRLQFARQGCSSQSCGFPTASLHAALAWFGSF